MWRESSEQRAGLGHGGRDAVAPVWMLSFIRPLIVEAKRAVDGGGGAGGENAGDRAADHVGRVEVVDAFDRLPSARPLIRSTPEAKALALRRGRSRLPRLWAFPMWRLQWSARRFRNRCPHPPVSVPNERVAATECRSRSAVETEKGMARCVRQSANCCAGWVADLHPWNAPTIWVLRSFRRTSSTPRCVHIDRTGSSPELGACKSGRVSVH